MFHIRLAHVHFVHSRRNQIRDDLPNTLLLVGSSYEELKFNIFRKVEDLDKLNQVSF